jgi:hypothetical protein
MADYGEVTDSELFERLKTEHEKLPVTKDRDDRLKLWREIDRLNAEIQGRYPLSTTPL